MNKVVLIGRLTRDPELRYTQSGKAFATFTLAVDRRFRRQAEQNGQPTADFIPCVAWDKLAEIIGNNLTKGRRVGVEGRLQTRTYDAQDGSKRSAFDVVLDELEFLEPKNGGQQGGYGQGFGAPGAPVQQAPAGNDFGPNISDEEIPF
jgi:single-strand DNA-binding protein